MAVQVRYNSWYIPLRSRRDNNVKWPNFALPGERTLRRLIVFDSFDSDEQSK